MFIVPIIVNNTIACHFFVVPSENGEPYVQLGTELVNSLNTYLNCTDFAVIYDDQGAYLYTENCLYLLGYADKSIVCSNEPQVDATTAAIESVGSASTQLNVEQVSSLNEEDFETIECVPIETYDSLDVEAFLPSLPSPRSYISKYLSVEIIQQPEGTNICWAIAMTSIINYLYNSD